MTVTTKQAASSLTVNRAERRKLPNKNVGPLQTRVDTQMIGTKKITFQFTLKNMFAELKLLKNYLDDISSQNKSMTELIEQRATI